MGTNLHRRLATLAFVLCACGPGSGGVTTDTDMSTTTSISDVSTSAPTTTALATTTTEDRFASCPDATQILIGAVSALLDRADADPNAVLESDDVTELFTEIGTLIREDCGPVRSGDAISELIVWGTEERSARGLFSASIIDGILEGLCTTDWSFDLSLTAQAACTGF